MKIGIILDNYNLETWQLNSLHKLNDNIKIEHIFICKNTFYKKYLFRNFLYYLYNFLFQNKYRKKVNINKVKILTNVRRTEFFTNYELNWQILPKEIIMIIKDKKINTIIKFGTNLLKIDENLKNINILSYHHGDPEYFRGKAPCFYEILNKFAFQGVVVQKINNTIDKGDILAEAKCKVFFNSYKKSLENCYNISSYLLDKALINLSNNQKIKKVYNNNIYKLPENLIFIKFLLLILVFKIKRLFFLIFFYRKWQIASGLFDYEMKEINGFSEINLKSNKHLFYADPFYINKNIIIFEGYNFLTGLGEVLSYDFFSKKIRKISKLKTHFSYPFIINLNSKKYLLPEISNYKKSSYFYLENGNNKLSKPFKIKGMDKYRIIDPTILKFNGKLFLFCNLKNYPVENLYIFYSPSIEEEFTPHKLNPVIIDIHSSRMAGNFLIENENIYRLSQNNSNEYGDGISISKIICLNENQYKEKFIKLIKFKNKFGPHTLNICERNCIFDYYKINFSLLSIIYRIIQSFSYFFIKHNASKF